MCWKPYGAGFTAVWGGCVENTQGLHPRIESEFCLAMISTTRQNGEVDEDIEFVGTGESDRDGI